MRFGTDYTPLRTLTKILFLMSSWVLHKQKKDPKGDIAEPWVHQAPERLSVSVDSDLHPAPQKSPKP